MSAQNAGSLENTITLYDHLYPHPEESVLKKIAYAPFRGAKEWFSDSYYSFKEANKPLDPNAPKPNGLVKILKGYGGSAVGGAAALAGTRGLQEIIAGATNTTLSGLHNYNFFDFKGLLGYTYPDIASAGFAGKAAGVATATIPYFLPIALGTYLLAKGAKDKSLIKTGIGSGMIGAGVFNIAGDYAMAAKTIFSGILPAIGSTPVLLYGLAATLALGSYHIGKKIMKGAVKKMFGTKKAEEHKADASHGADAHGAPAPAGAGVGGEHHFNLPENYYNSGNYQPQYQYRNAA